MGGAALPASVYGTVYLFCIGSGRVSSAARSVVSQSVSQLVTVGGWVGGLVGFAYSPCTHSLIADYWLLLSPMYLPTYRGTVVRVLEC
ncbi:hypothetical protein F4779DRAFT_219120 [Xylariaceae sp. FL0662B]|nr:hypothetical protein F4779DRAFT_219120 [Xylariaceae sp. FL0662B]